MSSNIVLSSSWHSGVVAWHPHPSRKAPRPLIANKKMEPAKRSLSGWAQRNTSSVEGLRFREAQAAWYSWIQEISNRTHVSRSPKPEYLIARSQLTERGSLVRSHSISDGLKVWEMFLVHTRSSYRGSTSNVSDLLRFLGGIFVPADWGEVLLFS